MNKIKKDEQKPEKYFDAENTTNGRVNIQTTVMGKKIVIGIIIVVGIATAGVFYYAKMAATGANADSYQAVFLNSGQVYFGKLSNENELYPVLRDVFYLQISQPPQPLQKGETPPANMSLIKLGGELHGPTDEMKINRNQIIFIENLRPDSRVVQSILQYKKGNP